MRRKKPEARPGVLDAPAIIEVEEDGDEWRAVMVVLGDRFPAPFTHPTEDDALEWGMAQVRPA